MIRVVFVPDQIVADGALAEYVEHESSRATLKTDDGREYRGVLLIEGKR